MIRYTTYVGASSVPTVLSRTVVKVGTITGSSIAEVTAALNAASQTETNTGLSSANKRIIIGVVAGVGGFIILAGLAFLGVRIMGKRNTASSSTGYKEARTDSPFLGPKLEQNSNDERPKRHGMAANF